MKRMIFVLIAFTLTLSTMIAKDVGRPEGSLLVPGQTYVVGEFQTGVMPTIFSVTCMTAQVVNLTGQSFVILASGDGGDIGDIGVSGIGNVELPPTFNLKDPGIRCFGDRLINGLPDNLHKAYTHISVSTCRHV